MTPRNSFASRPVIALVMALALTAGVAEAQTKVKTGFNLFSAEQDVEIGRGSAVQAEQQLPILRDADVENYINRIGQKLAAHAGGPGFRYNFKVVNASDINAFALPGGYIYINRGIIDNARNEGEIAGVIAHEIAHVSLRHGTHQASKAYAAQAGISILGGLLGGKVGQNTANIINTVGGLGLNVLFLKYSRDLETQADVRGAQILAAAGYTPADMVAFFRQLERVDGSKKTSFLSDHPAPPDRIARIEKERQLLREPATPTTNVAELNDVKSRMNRYGAAPTMAQIARSGPAAGGGSTGSAGSGSAPSGNAPMQVRVEAPSSSMSTFTNRSGLYRVSFPSNWRVYEEGQTGVTIAPPGGIGELGGRQEVVYGAIINHYHPFGNTSSSLRGSSSDVSIDDATNDLLTQIQRSSPHLRLLRNSGQRFNLSGGNAIAASLRGVNPNTRIDERVTVITRKLADGHLVYMLFVTPERDSANYSRVLQAMVNSMQVDDLGRH